MTEKPPLVTVIAVCYNHSRFVIECLESIRAQTYTNVQLIIMDDCSSDESVTLISDWIKLHQIKCEFIAHKVNRGLCRTLNEALTLAQGEFTSLIATDDLWLPEKTAIQVDALNNLPSNVGVVYGDSWKITEEGELLSKPLLESYVKKYGELPNGNIYNRLLDGDFIPALNPLVRRNCYQVVGEYDERLAYEDWDMWLRIAQKFDFHALPAILTKYRYVSTSMTQTILEKRSIEKHRTNFLMFSKHVNNPLLNKNKQRTIKTRLIKDAEILYELNAPDRAALLWKCALLTQNASLYAISFIAIFVPYYRLNRALKYIFSKAYKKSRPQ